MTESSVDKRKSLNTKDHFVSTCQFKLAATQLLKELLQQKSVCFDTETTSLDALEAELVGIAFSWIKGKGYYLALP